MADPYEESHRRRMDAFQVDLWKRLDQVPTLPAEQAVEVVKYLLQLACKASHVAPIVLGRRSLIAIPRAWLVERLDEVAGAALDLSDEWEYRRYLEACSFVDPAFAERVVQSGLASDTADIREAATDFAGHCAEFALRYHSSMEGPPLQRGP